jgi:hypothetical protein
LYSVAQEVTFFAGAVLISCPSGYAQWIDNSFRFCLRHRLL